jgi:hypothetical protein
MPSESLPSLLQTRKKADEEERQKSRQERKQTGMMTMIIDQAFVIKT